MKNITIKDIAKIANVSYATVSRALSGVPGVSDETRSRILKICEEIGYTPDYMARSMVTKSTKLIGLIVPDISILSNLRVNQATTLCCAIRSAAWNRNRMCSSC